MDWEEAQAAGRVGSRYFRGAPDLNRRSIYSDKLGIDCAPRFAVNGLDGSHAMALASLNAVPAPWLRTLGSIPPKSPGLRESTAG